ncbi:hypothetical protein RQP46_002500 [Phenoliferia psychrophenolica]
MANAKNGRVGAPRALLIVAGAVLCFLVLGTYTSPEVPKQAWDLAKDSGVHLADSTKEWWTGGAGDGQEDASDETSLVPDVHECTSAEVAVVNRPGFWIASESAPFTYQISPRNVSHTLHPSCLDAAIFATRIVSRTASTAAEDIIAPLPAPSLFDPSSGVYQFTIDPERGKTVEVLSGAEIMLGQVSFTPNASAGHSPLIWIHLVGDSNIRNLFGAVVGSFGKGSIAAHEVTDSPIRNGTFASIALRSSTSRKYNAKPNVIITWTWWESKSQDYESNADELDHWTSGTLSEFLARASLPDALGKHPDLERAAVNLQPTRTYVSLGSHSEDLTAYGTTELLDVLLSSEHLSERRRAAANLRVFTTTFVQSGKIPLNKFPHQDIVRNNAMIRGKNIVLRERGDLAGRVIDAEGLTDGITDSYMRHPKVHLP